MKKLVTLVSAFVLTTLTMTISLTGCAANREPFAGACNRISNDADKIYAKLTILYNSKSLTYSDQRDDIWAAGYRTPRDYFESIDSDTSMIGTIVGFQDESGPLTQAERRILDNLLEHTDDLSKAFTQGRMDETYDKIVADVQAIREACNLM